MPTSSTEWKNSKNLTPRELFTKEHRNLLRKAERWMNSTANSCMLVSTVIATGVFSALFSLPGGIADDDGMPHYLKKPIFMVFVISDGTAVISSSTATLIFLSILISRYAEDDFRRSLPSKLIFGLLMLFISITSMMVAFSSALFITYHHGLKWVPSLISVMAFLPIPVFVFLQFKLWSDILYSTYYCRSLFRPRKRIIR